jgi:hypothetical protein
MPVKALENDKPKIAAHAAMMAVQNFGFMLLYYGIWGATPSDETCESTRFAVGFFTLSCFGVSFLCIGMGMGGYTGDAFLFPFYWIMHAIVAVGGYSSCTYLIPAARFSVEGENCAALAPVNGERLKYVFYLHAALYFVYVYSMLSVTYYSWAKATFFSKGYFSMGMM